MRDDREKLLDVREAIERIEKYAARGRAALDDDELIQTWVLHHLQIIGEAVRGLSEKLKQVWPVIENDLPALKANVARILGEI